VTRVLVVDDDPPIRRVLSINLRARGYDVETVPDGRSALAACHQSMPDVIVLDLGLPDLDGVDVVRQLRQFSSTPVLVLSARQGSADKVGALDAGADDFVTKPFGVDELLARLRALLRRAGAAEEEQTLVELTVATVDLAAHTVVRRDDGTTIRLTPTEWKMLEALVRHPGRLVTQRDLLHQVWGPAYENESNYLRLYVGQLRRKLEADPSRPRHLLTEPGMGYRFQP
jgi:two-component system KDP operon response regulator KdpE